VHARAIPYAREVNFPVAGTMRLGPDVLASWTLDVKQGVLRVAAHHCTGMSTAYFLARLLNALAKKRGETSTAFADTLDASEDSLVTEVVEGPTAPQAQ